MRAKIISKLNLVAASRSKQAYFFFISVSSNLLLQFNLDCLNILALIYK